jgi:hypothetical protein
MPRSKRAWLHCDVDGFHHQDFLLRLEGQQHVGRRVHLAGRTADAEADSGEFLGAQMLDDALHALLPARAAVLADAQGSQWEVHVVENDDDLAWRNLVEARQRADRLAAEVHVGLRLGEDHREAIDRTRSHPGLALFLVKAQAVRGGQGIHAAEADVVAGGLVSVLRVPQADDEMAFNHDGQSSCDRSDGRLV